MSDYGSSEVSGNLNKIKTEEENNHVVEHKQPYVSKKEILRLTHRNSQHFTGSANRAVTVTKKGTEKLGFNITPTGPNAVIPSCVVEDVTLGGPAHRAQIQIGDQILKVNGASVIGMKFAETVALIQGCSQACEIEIELVAHDGGSHDGLMPQKVAMHHNSEEEEEKLRCLPLFTDPKNFRTIRIQKAPGVPVGIKIDNSLPDCPMPGVFITHIDEDGGCGKNEELQVGDNLMKVNGQSCVGMTVAQATLLLNGVSKGGLLKLECVRTKRLTRHVISDPRCMEERTLGLTISEGVVRGVEAQGRGYLAGLRVGHRIIAVEGRCTHGESDHKVMEILDAEAEQSVDCIKSVFSSS